MKAAVIFMLVLVAAIALADQGMPKNKDTQQKAPQDKDKTQPKTTRDGRYIVAVDRTIVGPTIVGSSLIRTVPLVTSSVVASPEVVGVVGSHLGTRVIAAPAVTSAIL